VWSSSVSAQLKTTVSAPSACFYTTQRQEQTGHRLWAVRGFTCLEPTPFPPRGWGTINLPGLNPWAGSPPPPHPACQQQGGQFADPKPYHLSQYCTHVTSPTQRNRALERISPKPMVDGFVKIFDEFRNGCDKKPIQYRHTYCYKYKVINAMMSAFIAVFIKKTMYLRIKTAQNTSISNTVHYSVSCACTYIYTLRMLQSYLLYYTMHISNFATISVKMNLFKEIHPTTINAANYRNKRQFSRN